MSNINLNIVGTGNFTQVEAAIKHLQSSIAQLNAVGVGGGAFNRSLTQSIAQVNALAQAQGLMKVHTTSLATEADRLTSRIAKGKTTFQDFKGAVAGATKANSVYMEVAKKQLAIQNMSAIQVGKTIFGYENLGKAQLSAAAAAQAHATAIAASNAVMRQSMIHVVNWGKNMQWTGRQLTMGLTMPLALFGAQAAKIFNEVDKNLTRLAKVYGVGLAEPTNAALASIRTEIIALSTELGKTLGISAAEVTDIAAQFAAAGLQSEQLVAATKQAARMVILGEADKQEAINATISLQTAYKLNTEELTEAVNFFNAAQAATSTNMADLINAIPRVGPIIKGLGGTYKDMVAILTALKEGGVPAGEAANAIKNSLGRIINPTKAAKDELMKFGIDIEGIVNKNAGNLVATLFELQSGLKGLDSLSRQRAISELFGKYQFARMAAFIENFGAINSQSAKVMEMMGLSAVELANIADSQTKKIQQSASGRFKIAMETLKNTMLPLGERALEMFTKVLEVVTKFFDAVNNLPGPLKDTLKWLLIIGGVVGPLTMLAGLFGNLIGTVGMGIVRLKVFGGALKMLFTTRDATAAKMILGGFKELDPAVTAASKAINIFKDQEVTAEQAGERFAALLREMTGGLISLQDASVAAGVAASSAMVQTAEAAAQARTAMGMPMSLPISQGTRGAYQGYAISHDVSKQYLMQNPEIQRRISALGMQGSYANILVGASSLIPKAGGQDIQAAWGDRSVPFYNPASGMSREQHVRQILATAGKNEQTINNLIASYQGDFALIAKTIQEDSMAVSKYVEYLSILSRKSKSEIETLNANILKAITSGNMEEANAIIQGVIAQGGIQSEAAIKKRAEGWVTLYQKEAKFSEESALKAYAVAKSIDQLDQMMSIKATEATGLLLSKSAGKDAFTMPLAFLQAEQAGTTVALNIVESIRKIETAAQAKVNEVSSKISAVAAEISTMPTSVKVPMFRGAASTAYNQAAIEAQSALLAAENEAAQAQMRINGLKKLAETQQAAIVDAQARVAALTNDQARQQESITSLMSQRDVIQAEINKQMKRRLTNETSIATRDAEVVALRQQMIEIDRQLAIENVNLKTTTAALSDARGVLTLSTTSQIPVEEIAEEISRQESAMEARLRDATAKLAQAREAQSAVPVGGITNQRLAGIGMGASMLTMAPMMMGVQNETVMQMSMAGMAASMLPMMAPMLGLGALGGGPMIALMALITAIPLLIKGIKSLIGSLSEVNRAMDGAFKTSQSEADLLGIKLKNVNDLGFKPITKEAAKATDEISAMADQIKQLEGSDPLKKFTESLMGLDAETQLEMLQNKYLTLRIQGVDDREARDFIKAILRAAGLEVRLGAQVAGIQTATGTQTEMITRQAQNALALANQSFGFFETQGSTSAYLEQFAQNGLGMGPSLGDPFGTFGPGADAARKSVEGLTESLISLVASSDVSSLDDQMKDLEKTMGKSEDSANLLTASVRELYVQAGMLDVWDKFKGKAFTATRAIELLRLQAVGLANDLDYLASRPQEIEIRYKYYEEYSAIGQSGSKAIEALTPKASSTTWESKAVSRQEKSAQSIADKQKLIVDQLQKELDLRNKILAAQDKANTFSMSQADLQQKYNEALAAGDLGEAAKLHRQMTVEQARYNRELKTTAMQNRLDKAKDRLSVLEKELDTAKEVTKSIQKQKETLSDYSDELNTIITTGKGDLDKLAKTLLEKFNIPIKETKNLVATMQAEFKSNAIAQFATNAGSALDSKLVPSQKQAAILATYLNILSDAAAKGNYNLRPEEAYRQAIQSVVGGQITMRGNAKSGFRYFQTMGPIGSERSVEITNSGIVPSYNPGSTAPKMGGQTNALPSFSSKSQALSARNNQTEWQYEGKTWRVIKPPFSGEDAVVWAYKEGNEWTIPMTGAREVQYKAMGGIIGKVKSYGMGGKIMNYMGGSWGGIKGPGSWTSDSIPAMLSNGEYVVNAAAVSKVGTSFMDTLNSLGYANSAPLMSIISATGSPVIPVEIVPSNNSSSLYNDHSQIIVNVANSNASANDIANAVYGAIQRRDNMVGSRTVVS